MSRSTLALALCLGLTGACEGKRPEARGQAPRGAAPPAKAEAEAKPPAVEDEAIPIPVTLPEGSVSRSSAGAAGGGSPASFADGPRAGVSLKDCLSRCNDASLSEDNRATCRLLCESHHHRAAGPLGAALVDGYFGCFDQCAGKSACRQRCAASVADDQACARACLETLGRCLGPCESSENEGRCAERCETAARRCVEGC